MFVAIESGKSRFSDFPKATLRLAQSGITLSPDIAEQIQSGRQTRDRANGAGTYEAVQLGLAMDVDARKIKLEPTAKDKFWFYDMGAGILRSTTVPSQLRRSGLPVGDYLMTDKENRIFTLAE